MTPTESKWAARVKTWRESGQTVEEFAAGKDYRAGTLRIWASRVARMDRAVPMARVVRRTDEAALASAGVAVEILGARIVVSRGFDAELLREVISALGTRR